MRICPNTRDQKLYLSSHMCGHYEKNPSLAKWILPSMDILEQDHTLFAKTYTLFIIRLIRIPTQHWCIPFIIYEMLEWTYRLFEWEASIHTNWACGAWTD